MRPAHVYADLTAAQHTDLVTALHQQWRVAARAVMVLLPAGGMSAAEIAEVLHCDRARKGSRGGRPAHHVIQDPSDRP